MVLIWILSTTNLWAQKSNMQFDTCFRYHFELTEYWKKLEGQITEKDKEIFELLLKQNLNPLCHRIDSLVHLPKTSAYITLQYDKTTGKTISSERYYHPQKSSWWQYLDDQKMKNNYFPYIERIGNNIQPIDYADYHSLPQYKYLLSDLQQHFDTIKLVDKARETQIKYVCLDCSWGWTLNNINTEMKQLSKEKANCAKYKIELFVHNETFKISFQRPGNNAVLFLFEAHGC